MRSEAENLDIVIDVASDNKPAEAPEETDSGLKSGGAAVAAWMIRNVYMEDKDGKKE